MSGGHFDYKQYQLQHLADDIEREIERCKRSGELGPQTIREFYTAIEMLKRTFVYVHRIDWLLSGDDGESTFKQRLYEELNKL